MNARITLMALILIQFVSYGQVEVNQPTLLEFFDKLKSISPEKENLRYDTFPEFDFRSFEPARKKKKTTSIIYVVGLTKGNKMSSVTLIKNKVSIGTMVIYDFKSFKIVLFEKNNPVLGEYPDFPILCISKESRFVVSLNKGFEYHYIYKPEDIATIQILQEELFPVHILTVRDSYIRMVMNVKYSNIQSLFKIESVGIIFIFQPEKSNNLLISDKSQFQEDYLMPRADFDIQLKVKDKYEGLPSWIYGGNFSFD